MRKIMFILILVLIVGCNTHEHNNEDGHHEDSVMVKNNDVSNEEVLENNENSDLITNQEIDNTDKELNVDVLSESNAVTFKLTGENYKYVLDGVDNPELRVKQGDKVIVEFESTQGFHDWAVDEFGKTGRVRTDDGVTTVEFIADKKGTFEYYCSVGNHRALGMKGNLIVE